nr:hypothetical protein GCM10017745_65570 [Saccharothrix mutabilis subsp. capreolus]
MRTSKGGAAAATRLRRERLRRSDCVAKDTGAGRPKNPPEVSPRTRPRRAPEATRPNPTRPPEPDAPARTRRAPTAPARALTRPPAPRPTRPATQPATAPKPAGGEGPNRSS